MNVSCLLDGPHGPHDIALGRCPGMAAHEPEHDPVEHPRHYNAHPSGVECIEITEHMNFNVGNAVKYLWRADLKNGLEDLRKAEWYVRREIERQTKLGAT